MTRTSDTHEHPTSEPKKSGCCGESHTQHEKAQPVSPEQAAKRTDTKREHPHHADDGSCCCGSGKASK